jgi:hypothetical protein
MKGMDVMGTQDVEKPVVQKVLQRKGLRGTALALILFVILGLFGLLAITFADRVPTVPASGTTTGTERQRPTPHPGATPTPTPLLTPTPRPSPSPTGPLPPTLSQAIATLQAQNRLFYSGNAHLPEIALTFDDGPHPYYSADSGSPEAV